MKDLESEIALADQQLADRDTTIRTQGEEIKRLKEAGVAFEEERQRQSKISMRQHDVVEAARQLLKMHICFHPSIHPFVRRTPLHDALFALDKVTESCQTEPGS